MKVVDHTHPTTEVHPYTKETDPVGWSVELRANSGRVIPNACVEMVVHGRYSAATFGSTTAVFLTPVEALALAECLREYALTSLKPNIEALNPGEDWR